MLSKVTIDIMYNFSKGSIAMDTEELEYILSIIHDVRVAIDPSSVNEYREESDEFEKLDEHLVSVTKVVNEARKAIYGENESLERSYLADIPQVACCSR